MKNLFSLIAAFCFVGIAGAQTVGNVVTATNTITTSITNAACNAHAGTFTTSLPTTPITGELFTFVKINADTNVCVLFGNGKLIEGSSFLRLATANQPVSITFDGTQWRYTYIPSGGVSSGTAVSSGSVGALQISGGSGQPITSDPYISILSVDHSITTVGPRAMITSPVFATGTGISGTPGTNCSLTANADGNPTGAADPTSTYFSTCAISNALLYQKTATLGNLVPQLYVPHGTYRVRNPSGTTAVFSVNGTTFNMVGDGMKSSIIQNESPQADLFSIINSQNVNIHDVGLQGLGSTTTGNLLDLISDAVAVVHDINFQETAGAGLNNGGSTERGTFTNLKFGNVAQTIKTSGNTNEDYYTLMDFTFSGQVNNGWYFGVNANPYTGQLISNSCTTATGSPTWASGTTYSANQTVTQSGITYNSIAAGNVGNTPQFPSAFWNECGQTIRPEARAMADFSGGDNVHVADFSAKATQLGGAKIGFANFSIHHGYCESGDQTGARSFAYCLAMWGKMEIGHLTAAISASALALPVDDAFWHGEFVTDPNTAIAGLLSTDTQSAIYPIDYVYGGTAASAFWTGMLTGQYELVNMLGYAGDNAITGYLGSGSAHVSSRAINGTVAPGVACNGTTITTQCGPGPVNAAVTIPAPAQIAGVLTYNAVIEELPYKGANTVSISDFHMNMTHGISNSDTGINSFTTPMPATGQWIGNPSMIPAEVFAGPVPDGFAVQQPNIKQTPIVSLSITNSYLNSCCGPLTGRGWVAASNNANVTFYTGNGPLYNSFYNPATIFNAYATGNGNFEFVSYGGNATATGTFEDIPAHFTQINQSNNINTIDAMVYINGVYQIQHIGSAPFCEYITLPNSVSTSYYDYKTCLNTSGFQYQYIRNNTLNTDVIAPWSSSHLFTEISSNTNASAITLPVANVGTIPGDGVYRSACSTTSNTVAAGGTGNAGSTILTVNLTGFATPGPSTYVTMLPSGLPPGVVYNEVTSGFATDSFTGLSAGGMKIVLCNTDTVNTKTIPAGTTFRVTQIQ